MQHITDKLLMPTEKVILAAKVHPIVFFWGAFGTVVALGFLFEQPALGLVILAFAAFEFFRMAFYYWGTELVLTNERIIAKFGIIQIRVYEIRLERIESFSVQQSLMGRFLNYGRFVVSGLGGIYIQIPMIIAPFAFRRKVIETLENLRIVQLVQLAEPVPPPQPKQPT